MVLLVLVIRTVCFNDSLASNAVDSTWDSVCGNELCKITVSVSLEIHCTKGELTYRSRKSTVTPKSFAMLSRPTTR